MRIWVFLAAVGLAAGLATAALWIGGGATASAARANFTPPACPLVTYRSAPSLNAQSVCMNLGVTTHGTQPGTYLFLTPGSRGAGIYRDNGQLVWWLLGPATGSVGSLSGTYNFKVVQLWGQRYLATWTGGNGVGEVTLYDNHYRVAGHVTAGAGFPPASLDLHEFRVNPDNTALISIYQYVSVPPNHTQPKNWAEQFVVRKLQLVRDSSGIHTGNVLFQWRSYNSGDVPLSQSRTPDPGSSATYDYFHGNALAQDSDGNILVSSRGTWGIYKIDTHPGDHTYMHTYGHVMWEVGAPRDSAHAPWCFQHAISALGNGNYSLFDNGGSGPGCAPGSTNHPANGIIFHVTLGNLYTNAQVTPLHYYTHNPPIYTDFTGLFQPLGNGDGLVSWADVPVISEYDQHNNVLMDLSMSNWSYRGFRYLWSGQPLTPPSIASVKAKTGDWVWASWNGATTVAYWRVLGGPDASHLRVVSPNRAASGFETAMFVNPHNAVAVQALDKGGHVLGTSGTVKPS